MSIQTPIFMERKGKIEDLDRSFDLEYWRAQTDAARFSAAWELVITACKVQGKDVSQLRLQRSVETFQQLPTEMIDADSLKQSE